MPKEKRRIKSVFVFANGMVAVCDQYGEQMPRYQGRWDEKEAKIRRDAGPSVKWNFASEWKANRETP